jgi:hypothetical protein
VRIARSKPITNYENYRLINIERESQPHQTVLATSHRDVRLSYLAASPPGDGSRREKCFIHSEPGGPDFVSEKLLLRILRASIINDE